MNPSWCSRSTWRTPLRVRDHPRSRPPTRFSAGRVRSGSATSYSSARHDATGRRDTHTSRSIARQPGTPSRGATVPRSATHTAVLWIDRPAASLQAFDCPEGHRLPGSVPKWRPLLIQTTVHPTLEVRRGRSEFGPGTHRRPHGARMRGGVCRRCVSVSGYVAAEVRAWGDRGASRVHPRAGPDPHKARVDGLWRTRRGHGTRRAGAMGDARWRARAARRTLLAACTRDALACAGCHPVDGGHGRSALSFAAGGGDPRATGAAADVARRVREPAAVRRGWKRDET